MPTGLEAQGTLAPVSREGHRERVRSQIQSTLRRSGEQHALADSLYSAAKQSPRPYTVDLGELAQSIGGDAGRDFFRNPDWVQSIWENPSPLPKPDRGFLARMGARFSDGSILAQMGRVGARALVGDLTEEEAREQVQELRGGLSNMEWLQHAKGVGPEINRQLAVLAEMGGMQADILVNEAGIAALAGVALGSPGGPPLMAAAGLAGLKGGFVAGNIGMMSGLEYLDLLDQRIVLEDGTQVPIPDHVARATAGAVGIVGGVIEYLQWAMVPGGSRIIGRTTDIVERTLSRMMREGTMRRLAARGMIVGGVAGGAEVAQEVAQEVGSAVGSEVALSIGESEVGGVRVDGLPLGEAIRQRVGQVLSVAGGIGLMGVPSGIRAFMRGSQSNVAIADAPETLFDRQQLTGAQPIALSELGQLDPVSPRARALAEEAVRKAQAGEAPLPPIRVQPSVIAVQPAEGQVVEAEAEAVPAGPAYTVPAESDRALVEVLRSIGSPYVPATALLPDGSTQQEAAAGPGVAAEGAGAQPLSGQALRRDPAAFDELWHQIRGASSVSTVSDDQVTTAALVMENAVLNTGMTVREWLDRRFPNGMAMSPEAAARAVQAGQPAEPAAPPREPPTPEPEAQVETEVEEPDPEELRRQMYDAMPPAVRQALSQGMLQSLAPGDPRVAEAQRTGLLDAGRLTELGMWAEERARGERRAEEVAAAAEPQRPLATPPAPSTEPQWSTVDPIRLQVPEVVPKGEQGPAVVAWEGADGMLQVVGGHARANLLQRMRADGEFEAPVQVVRADDGWTMDEALRRGPELSRRAADGSLVDVARSIRGLPIDEVLAASLPLDRRRTHQALGLAQLEDEAWSMVDDGQVPPEHGSWVGILAEDGDLQVQLMESFAADPAETTFEAESRVRLRQRFGIDKSVVLARSFSEARLGEVDDLRALAQQLAQRGGPLHQAATVEHLSEGEVWGRALHYWLSGQPADGFLEESGRSGDDLLSYLRDLLTEEQEAAAPESSADELARAMFVRRFHQGDIVERIGAEGVERGTVVIGEEGVPVVRIGDVLEPVAARTASRWRRVEGEVEPEPVPEGADPPRGPRLEALLSLPISDFVSSIAGEPDAEPVVRALIRAFGDVEAVPEFVAAARERLGAFVGRRESGRWTINELQPWRKYNRSRRWWFDLPEEQRQRDVEEARAERMAGGETITPDEQRMVEGVEAALEAVESPPEPTAEDAESELVSREAEDLHRTARRDWVASLLGRRAPRPTTALPATPDAGGRFSAVRQLQQRRVVPGGEQAAKLTQHAVETYGVVETLAEAGFALPDGRLLARPPRGAALADTFMEQTGSVKVDGRRIQAAGPLSVEQIEAVLLGADDGLYELVTGEHRLRTTEPLNADTLISHFARTPAPDPVTETEVLGVTEVDASGRVQIALAEGADFDTLMEELFHAFRLDLPADQEAVIGAWAGAQENPDGTWTWNEQAEETFARGAIQFLRDSRTRYPDAVRSVFQKVRDWLRRLYAGIRLQMPDDVRRAYEDLLIGSDRPEVLAYERLQRAMHDGRQKVEFDDGNRRLVVQQMKQAWVVDHLDDDDNRLARREHETLDDALRDVAGVPTVRTPVPIGNPDYAEAGPPKIIHLPEASPETNELLVGDVVAAEEASDAVPSGSEVRVDPTQLLTDPSRFQYKGEVDEEWMRQRWRDTRVWSPLYSGKMVVWQDNSGSMWVVDGHQRTALAKLLAERGQPIPPVTAIIYHESDTSAEEARRFGALKNLVEGTGTEVDAAKVLRDLDPDEFDATAATLGTSNTVIQTARGLTLLTDEAFEVVAHGAVSPLHAAQIGERVSDPVDQMSLLREFAEEKPASAREAEALVTQWLAEKSEENLVEHSLFGMEVVAESTWRERAKVLSRALSSLEKRRRIFAAVSKPEAAAWLQNAGNELMGEANAAQMDQAQIMREVVAALAQQQGPISDALSEAGRAAREKGKVTQDLVNRFLSQVEEAISTGSIGLDMVQLAGTESRIQEAEANYRLFQIRRTPAESRDVGRRQARAQDIRTVEGAAGTRPRTEEPAGGHSWASAAASLRRAVGGARNLASAEARRHAIDTILRAANLSERTIPGDTRQQVGRAARAAIREAQAQATEREARRQAHAGNLRHGRERVRAIQRSLRGILRTSRTIPEPLRTELRQLARDLDIDRAGRMTRERLQPDQRFGTEVDPLRLLAAIDAVLVEEDRVLKGYQESFEPGQEAPPPPRLPGANPNIGPDTTLRDMSLLDLERLHRRIQAAVAIVRKGQAAQRQERRTTMRQEVTEVAGELAQTKVALSTRLPQVFAGVVELLGISSERPMFFLERIAGMRSRTYDVFWRRVKEGTYNERKLADRVTQEFLEGLRSIGVEMTGPKFEAWMNEKLDAPDAAAHIKPQWTRAELMSFAMTWGDPYARENLTEGGIVMVDDPLKKRPEEMGVKEVTEEAAAALIGLLGDQERRMIADEGPVRALFEHLFAEQNRVFREMNGYDLEKWDHWYPVHIARGYIPDTAPDGSALGHFAYGGTEGTAPYKGFLEFREGSKKPINVRPISTEVNAAIRHTAAYVGLEPALRTARAALYNPRVSTLLERQGAVAPKYLERYLQGVAHNSLPADTMEGALNTLRQNVTVATLASPSVSLNQALSYAVAAMHVPEKYLGMALSQLARPSQARLVMQRHRAMDPDFAARMSRGFDVDTATRSSRQALPESRTPLARRHAAFLDGAMWGLTRVDQWTVTRVEHAAVLHAMDAMAAGDMPKRMRDVLGVDNPAQVQALPADQRLRLAYQWGNWVIARTQPSHLPENLSDMQRRRGLRLFTSFSGYTNVAMNSWRSALANLMREKSPEAAKEAAWAIMSIAVIGPLGTALLHRLRDIAYGRDDEDRTPILADAAMGIFAMAYFVRDAGYAASVGFGYGSGWEPPVMEAIWDVGKGIDRVVGALGQGDRELEAFGALTSSGLELIGMPMNAIKGLGRGMGELTGLLDD